MTFITHGFRVSVVSDVRERVRDLASPLRFMAFHLLDSRSNIVVKLSNTSTTFSQQVKITLSKCLTNYDVHSPT